MTQRALVLDSVTSQWVEIENSGDLCIGRSIVTLGTDQDLLITPNGSGRVIPGADINFPNTTDRYIRISDATTTDGHSLYLSAATTTKTNGSGGNITITAGAAAPSGSGFAGSVSIEAGYKNGSNPGSINIGRVQDCTVNIGRSGQTTIINGGVVFSTFSSDTINFDTYLGGTTGLTFLETAPYAGLRVKYSASGTPVTLNIRGGDSWSTTGGNLYIDAGDGSPGGAITFGTTYANSISIGRTGKTTTVNGALTVSGDFTTSGTNTYINSTNAYFNSTNTVTFSSTNLYLNDLNIYLGNTVSSTIYVAGQNIQFAVGNHSLFVDTSPNDTIGGWLNNIAGNGGNASASSAGAGGSIYTRSGNGGNATTLVGRTAGVGGSITIASGNGGAGAVSTNPGATGGSMSLSAGTGGGNNGIGAGPGGSITISGGSGGTALAGVGNYGGEVLIQGGTGSGSGYGGYLNLYGGTSASGSGGNVTLRGGNANAGTTGSVTIDSGNAYGTSTGGPVSIGGSNATNIYIGRVGRTATFYGSIYVYGNTTLGSTSSFTTTHNARVILNGDASPVSIPFIKEVNHKIVVDDSTTVSVAGGNLTLQSGKGGVASVSGGGAGGTVALLANNGGASTSSQDAGAGGAISITAGNGGSDDGAQARGNTGGSITLTSGTGTQSVSNGLGGAINIYCGAGAAAYRVGGRLAPGKQGGTFQVQGGTGGDASSTHSLPGGDGGGANLKGGSGGACSGIQQGGSGGSCQVIGGNGGAAASCDVCPGGGVTIRGGTGGLGAVGYASGDGGTLTLSGGYAGSKNGGTDGTGGNVIIDGGKQITGSLTGYISIGGGTNNDIYISNTGFTTYLMGASAFHRIESASDYNEVQGDFYIGITDTTAARNVYLLSAAQLDTLHGRVIVVKDQSGGAATNNITVWPNGAETIDGAASYKIDQNYGSVVLMSDGSSKWEVVAQGKATASGGGLLIDMIPVSGLASTQLTTETQIGGFNFDPTRYVIAGKTTVLTLEVAGFISNTSATGTVNLRNVSTGALIASITFTGVGSTTQATKTASVTLPGVATEYALFHKSSVITETQTTVSSRIAVTYT